MESVSASAHRVMYGVPLFGCYRLGGGMLSKKAVKNDWCARKQNKKKFFFSFFFVFLLVVIIIRASGWGP